MDISIVKLKKIVDGLVDWVRQDLIDNVLTPTQSWLYLEFNDQILDDTNFYGQLKRLIENGDDSRTRLEVRLMFDKERANLPTIHIHYPSEDGRSGDNTLGTGIGDIIQTDTEFTDVYSRSFIGQYELIITGGNSIEVVMLYEFLDGLLIAAADTLMYNFDLFAFNGKQLMANQDIIPYLTFYRAIGFSLQAKKAVRSLISRTKANNVDFTPNLYLDDQQPDALIVSVEITKDLLVIHVLETVTFSANIINGGTNPVYNWYLDDLLIAHTSILSLTSGSIGTKSVRCEILSDIQYLKPRPAISNTITYSIVA